jgi:malate dehydrogenase (oxaloacetate-decarboxylating)(NADP+)
MFFAAAKALARQVSEDDLKMGRIFPALERIRDVSAAVATAAAEVAYDQGLAREPKPDDLTGHIRSMMYHPEYTSYV